VQVARLRLYDQLAIRGDDGAQRAVRTFVRVLGGDLDKNRLCDSLHDGTVRELLVANLVRSGVSISFQHWYDETFEFTDPITPDPRVNEALFGGRPMADLLKFLEYVAGEELAKRDGNGVPIPLRVAGPPDWFDRMVWRPSAEAVADREMALRVHDEINEVRAPFRALDACLPPDPLASSGPDARLRLCRLRSVETHVGNALVLQPICDVVLLYARMCTHAHAHMMQFAASDEAMRQSKAAAGAGAGGEVRTPYTRTHTDTDTSM
jgi:hypothetical protein